MQPTLSGGMKNKVKGLASNSQKPGIGGIGFDAGSSKRPQVPLHDFINIQYARNGPG
ncbi:MAG TPA: hypothetical protein VNT79_16590 [Phycisphaerae bacterium]|nr:hypothetical protein [Phycisphaerae bacterium]